MLIIHVNPSTNRSKEVCEPSRHRPAPSSCIGTAISHKICRCKLLCPINRRFRNCDFLPQSMTTGWFTFNQTIFISNSLNAMTVHSSDFIPGITLLIHLGYSSDVVLLLPTYEVYFFRSEQRLNIVDITFEDIFEAIKLEDLRRIIGNTSRKLTWTSISRFTQYIESWLYHYRRQIAPYHFLQPEKLAVYNIHSG